MKRALILQPLSRDHHQALVFSKRLQALAALPEQNRLQEWSEFRLILSNALLPHFDEEERYFLYELGVTADNCLFKKMLEDHQAMRACMNSDEVSQLQQFSDLLKAHIRFEERELFPWLEKEFSLE
ncbi:hemerythrin domain-containing protein [Neptunomonas japonica]|uniref:hemerythrin domain-containing protein n=1 Tax=Neptunomonas japonica TaxID=417574 RepID=UPI00042A8F0A|nr:hemerythrin domain-containing protein [Neptunomonas japonica]